MVQTIAFQCAYSGGEGVFIARNLFRPRWHSCRAVVRCFPVLLSLPKDDLEVLNEVLKSATSKPVHKKKTFQNHNCRLSIKTYFHAMGFAFKFDSLASGRFAVFIRASKSSAKPERLGRTG